MISSCKPESPDDNGASFTNCGRAPTMEKIFKLIIYFICHKDTRTLKFYFLVPSCFCGLVFYLPRRHKDTKVLFFISLWLCDFVALFSICHEDTRTRRFYFSFLCGFVTLWPCFLFATKTRRFSSLWLCAFVARISNQTLNLFIPSFIKGTLKLIK